MLNLTLPVGDRDHVQGPATAPVTLVEYGDYQCPHCGTAHPVVKKLQKKLGKNLRFVFRHFPLRGIHPQAQHAAEAAETAGVQNKFWEMHDWLFEHQGKLEDYQLFEAGMNLGLDGKFMKDLQEGVYAERVQEDFQSGIRSGVNGTPTFFINGLRYDGPPTLDQLLAGLQELTRKG